MKKLLTISILTLLSACGGKDSESTDQVNILENLTYSVDTAIVDPGDDFFNLGYGIAAKLTEDKSKLFFFEGDPLKLVQVDLDELKLISKTELQKEGPDGVGPYITGFQVGHDGNLAIKSFIRLGKFNTEGKLIESLNIFPEGLDSELENDFQKLYGSAVYSSKANHIYTQPSIRVVKEPTLFSIDPVTKTYKSFPIPKMSAVADFAGTFKTKSGENTMVRYFGPRSYTDIENEQLLLSGGSMSGFYRFDTKTDSLEFIDIHHSSVPNQWDFEVMKESSNEGKYLEDRRKVNEALNYMEIKWDESREIYFRFGKKTFEGDEKGVPPTYEFYLFAYDEDFNVLGETKLQEWKTEPSSYFWKDGKLYSYVNVEDELGFAVFTFDF